MTPKKKKIIMYVVLAIIVVLAIGGTYAYKEWNRKPKDTATTKEDISINCKVLIDEFVKDEKTANAKYLDKIIALNGIAKSIDKDENGFYTLVLGDTATSSSIRCTMDSLHNDDAAIIKEGASIKIKGICTGYIPDDMGLGADVILNKTSIVK
jgi:tRNA_anti-like